MTARLVYSEELSKYDFGYDHPMAPGRVRHTIELARQLGVLDRACLDTHAGIELRQEGIRGHRPPGPDMADPVAQSRQAPSQVLGGRRDLGVGARAGHDARRRPGDAKGRRSGGQPRGIRAARRRA